MKTYLAILVSVFVFASMAWGDPVDTVELECMAPYPHYSIKYLCGPWGHNTIDFTPTSDEGTWYIGGQMLLTVSFDSTVTFNPDTENECSLDEVLDTLRRCDWFIQQHSHDMTLDEWVLRVDIQEIIKKLEALTE